jgi:hypothetical protein
MTAVEEDTMHIYRDSQIGTLFARFSIGRYQFLARLWRPAIRVTWAYWITTPYPGSGQRTRSIGF